MNQVLEPVYSPCHGSVKEVIVKPNSYVYEWETLCFIETEDGRKEEVSIGISGIVTSVEVERGQEVTPSTKITVIQDDLEITGSD
ncbi:biotin/lipoyl-containing protein [Salirhabdus salicampi]|uniref:biotin/lipoyl-containing protein n=1 Tax=Salirhabdus salicampi TaxID=476102 RepID=UPI0020C32298|nr:biotin/lipoyl-containing protein [Salirhabdus salicampi]MCP8615946.1 hypothetical protein [Salirhabdus salicampi]